MDSSKHSSSVSRRNFTTKAPMEIGQKGCYLRTMAAIVQLQKKSGREPQRVLAPRRTDWRQIGSRKVIFNFVSSEVRHSPASNDRNTGTRKPKNLGC
jgi:hypothetical protein